LLSLLPSILGQYNCIGLGSVLPAVAADGADPVRNENPAARVI